MDDSRTIGSAQEVGMQKLRFEHALWSGLLTVVFAAGTATAQDDSGAEKVSSIDWRTCYRLAADQAAREGKPILVKVGATWCGPCRQMKQLTFADSRVIELVRSDFVALSIDADEHPELVTGFRVEAYPTTIIVAPDLTILKRMAGFQSATDLVAILSSHSRTQPGVSPEAAAGDVISALEPANAVKFGFDGYCLVSLLEENRVRKGVSEFTAEHRGQTICFQSDDNRQRFLADPEKYWPVANGQCLVSSREGTLSGPGDPRMAVTWRGRIWLFSDRQRQRRFIQTPLYYVNDL
jgi:thiol-disulfide isomerase/thioredoxin